MIKLIEYNQEDLIVCDNITCNFKVKNSLEEVTKLIDYLNKPCPLCGENLLTENDYGNHKKIIKIINFINKWFGWITYVLTTNKKPENLVSIETNKNIKIEIN